MAAVPPAPSPPPSWGDGRRRFLVALAVAALAVGLPLAGLALAWGFGMAQVMGDASSAREAVCAMPPLDDGSLRMEELDLRRRIAELERDRAARVAQCRPGAPYAAAPPPPRREAARPPPEVQRRPDDAQPCDVETRAGGAGETVTRHFLGPVPGPVVVAYHMRSVADRMQVFHGERLLAETLGFVRGPGEIGFDWNPPAGADSEALVVRVVVTGFPGSSSTRWSYSLGCPGARPQPGRRR